MPAKSAIVFDSKMECKTDTIWINCSKKVCTYGVHLKCLGFYSKNKQDETEHGNK